MKESLRLELVKRINSGDYLHGTGSNKKLVRTGHMEHCILGIILEVYLDEFPDKDYKWEPVSDLKEVTGAYYFFTGKGNYAPASALPFSVEDWAEFKEGEMVSLYNVNDMIRTTRFGIRRGYSSVLKLLTKMGGI